MRPVDSSLASISEGFGSSCTELPAVPSSVTVGFTVEPGPSSLRGSPSPVDDCESIGHGWVQRQPSALATQCARTCIGTLTPGGAHDVDYHPAPGPGPGTLGRVLRLTKHTTKHTPTWTQVVSAVVSGCGPPALSVPTLCDAGGVQRATPRAVCACLSSLWPRNRS